MNSEVEATLGEIKQLRNPDFFELVGEYHYIGEEDLVDYETMKREARLHREDLKTLFLAKLKLAQKYKHAISNDKLNGLLKSVFSTLDQIPNMAFTLFAIGDES